MNKKFDDFTEINTREELAQVSGGGATTLTLYKCLSGDVHYKQDPKSGTGGVDKNL